MAGQVFEQATSRTTVLSCDQNMHFRSCRWVQCSSQYRTTPSTSSLILVPRSPIGSTFLVVECLGIVTGVAPVRLEKALPSMRDHASTPALHSVGVVEGWWVEKRRAKLEVILFITEI